MCSIAGFISEKPLSASVAQNLTTGLLYYGAVRGEQSSGVAINGKILKRAIPPDEFICLDEYDALFEEGKRVSSALIHTRMPTSGGLGDEQAQPFKIGNTITIHNGWYNDCKAIKNHWNIVKKSGVDSHLVTAFINSYGIRKLPNFIRSSSGSSAIAALYNDNLYLIRSGNPIVYTYLDLHDNCVFMFASTDTILNHAMRYAFLVDANHPIKDVKEGILFHVNTKRVAKMSERVEHKRTFFPDAIFRGHVDNRPDWWKDRVLWSDEDDENENDYNEKNQKPEDIRFFEPTKNTFTENRENKGQEVEKSTTD